MNMPKAVFVWLLSAVEKRPIIFTVISGITSYLLAFLWLLIFIRMDLMASQLALVGASLIIVVFHWFIARYERNTAITQFISLLPAVGLVFILLSVFGEYGRTREVCVLDISTQELVDCKVWRD